MADTSIPPVGMQDIPRDWPKPLQIAVRLLIERARAADIIASIEAVSAADAPAQTGAYVQANVQAIATLANELKQKVDAIAAALSETRV